MNSKDQQDKALQVFLNAIPEPAFLISSEMVLRAANNALAERLGVDLSELIGRSMWSVLPEQIVAQRWQYIQTAITTGHPVVFEDSRAGRHFINHIMPVKEDGATVTAIAVLAHDMTEQKNAEELQRQSEERYRQIVTTSIEGVWHVNAHDETLFVNEQMAAMLGYPVSYFEGKNIFSFVAADSPEAARAAINWRTESGAARRECRFVRSDGSHVWTTLAVASLMASNGEYIGAVAMVTDITERRLLEKRMQQSQELERLGLLAGGIAHDFNNLLVGILGNVGLAGRSLPKSSPARSVLLQIENAAEMAASLTQELLAYSGKGQFQCGHLDLNELVSEVANLLSSIIPNSARLSLSLAADLPAVTGDAAQLRQVAINLLTNAIDSIGDTRGDIRITTYLQHMSASDLARLSVGDALLEGDFVCLEITDTGAGMDLATQERIFDPFFTTKFTGRGLGLAAVQGILRGHGAGLVIDSQVGRGTSFRLYFPSTGTAPLPSEAESTPVDDEWHGSGLVMVVDDDPNVANVAGKLLEGSGFEVLIFENGQAAIDAYREQGDKIDLVLLDMTMPGLSGTEVHVELRRINPDVRVVLTSGYMAESVISTGDDDPTGFLHKPYTIETFLATIRKALS